MGNIVAHCGISLQFKKVDEDCTDGLSLSQSVINIPRDFEGCNTLKKYFGQLHFLQSRVPMATGQEAAVPVTW